MTELTYSAHDLCLTRLCQAGGCENDAEPGWPLCARHDRMHQRGIPIHMHEIPPNTPDTLNCHECGQTKPDEAFRRKGNLTHRRRYRAGACLECEANNRAASRRSDPDYNAKQRAQKAAKRPETREELNAQKRAYRLANRDKINAQKRASRARIKATKAPG